MTMKKGRGRPRRLNSLGESFRDLYLDPLMQPSDICVRLGLSLRTYYRYEHELDLPTLRVAVGNASGLPAEKAWGKFLTSMERFDLEITRALSKKINARIKLVPAGMDMGAIQLLAREKVDIALSSLCWTKERSKTLYASNSYIPGRGPHGMLFALRQPRDQKTKPRAPSAKPRLGTALGSVHWEFASEKMTSEFEVCGIKGFAQTLSALKSGQIDYALLHPAVPKTVRSISLDLEIKSKTYYYDSHSAIFFHRDSELWRGDVNGALAELHEDGTLSALQRKFRVD